jgi:hypothetical protein
MRSGWPNVQGNTDLYVDAEHAARAAEIISAFFGDEEDDT